MKNKVWCTVSNAHCDRRFGVSVQRHDDTDLWGDKGSRLRFLLCSPKPNTDRRMSTRRQDAGPFCVMGHPKLYFWQFWYGMGLKILSGLFWFLGSFCPLRAFGFFSQLFFWKHTETHVCGNTHVIGRTKMFSIETGNGVRFYLSFNPEIYQITHFHQKRNTELTDKRTHLKVG